MGQGRYSVIESARVLERLLRHRLDTSQQQREKLLAEGIQRHAINALYPFDLTDYADGIADLLAIKEMAELMRSKKLDAGGFYADLPYQISHRKYGMNLWDRYPSPESTSDAQQQFFNLLIYVHEFADYTPTTKQERQAVWVDQGDADEWGLAWSNLMQIGQLMFEMHVSGAMHPGWDLDLRFKKGA